VPRFAFRVLILCVLEFLLSACTPVISPQLMDQVDRTLTYSLLASRPDEFKGKIVLLGGSIVQTVPKPKESEIEIVQKQLSSSGEPYLTDKSEGRYLVVVDRFLDPAIYRSGRDITVAEKFRARCCAALAKSTTATLSSSHQNCISGKSRFPRRSILTPIPSATPITGGGGPILATLTEFFEIGGAMW